MFLLYLFLTAVPIKDVQLSKLNNPVRLEPKPTVLPS